MYNFYLNAERPPGRIGKALMIMKVTVLLIVLAALHVSATTLAQKITLNVKNAPLVDVFNKINVQTGYDFLFTTTIIKGAKPVTVSVENEELSTVLQKIFSGQGLDFSIENKSVVISVRPPNPDQPSKAWESILLTGKVIDEKGAPMPGVTIRAKNAQNVWTTNSQGEFTLLVTNEKTVLQFSFVGYQTREFAITALKSPATVILKESMSTLDQVQVLAYSTTTKRLNTGSTYTVTADEIAKNPVPNVLQALNNRVPGLSVVQGTGQVGGAFTVRVRGINGLNAIDPLYIIDGVPFPAGGLNGGPGSTVAGGLPLLQNNRGAGSSALQGGNALNYINPDDIESVDVLKDADATSIYGSRGAYGVILITTKKGKAGKPKVTLNVNRSVSTVSSTPHLLNTDDYLMLRREALKNDGLTAGPADYDLNGTYSLTDYTNWAKQLLKSAPTTRLNANYSGGTDLTTFSVSGNYDNYGNVELHSGYSRDGSLRMQISNVSPNRKLSLDVTGLFTSTLNTMTPYDFTGDAVTLRAPNAPSFINPDGSINWDASGNSNPYAYLNVQYRSLTNNLLGSSTIAYRPIKGLTLKAIVAYNYLNGREFRATPSSFYNPITVGINNGINSTINAYSVRTVSFDPYISYDTQIAKGQLTVTAGGTLQDKYNEITILSGTGFVNDSRLNNPTVGISTSNSYANTPYRYDGLFGTIRYSWEDKYIIDFNGRYDGSTRFGPGHRYGSFGSVGGAYIFSQEKWFKEHLTFISFGKLRGSYGTTGGDGIPNYQYLSTYSTNATYLGNPTYLNSGLANPDLHWETTKKRDIGLTVGLLNDRVTFDIGYYRNTTSGSLVPLPLATTTGYSSVTLNSPAKVQSMGWEVSATSTNISTKHVRWLSTFVLTVPRTKLLSYPEGMVLTNSNFVVGLPLTNVKLVEYDGVDPQTGNYVFVNAAGVKSPYILAPTQADKAKNVDISTRYMGSLSNTISYKDFSLDFTFSFQRKVSINYQGSLSRLPGTIDFNETAWALDRWQKPGDITNVPKATTNLLISAFGQATFRGSTGAYEPIFFTRLQNANLSYRLPAELQSKLGVSNARIFVNGQNLFVLSKYRDLDPENPSLIALPPLRVINVGLNVTL